MRWKYGFNAVVIGCVIVISSVFLTITFAQESLDVCADVRWLMARDLTPYQMNIGGGYLTSNTPVSANLASDRYADFWSFTVPQPPDTQQINTSVPITLLVNQASGSALEMALFNGMVPLTAYQPVETGRSAAVTLPRFGSYTLVIRRVHVADESASDYEFVLSTSAANLSAPTTSEILDPNSQPFAVQPQITDGTMTLNLPTATIALHPDSIRRVNPRSGQSTQVYFPSNTFQNNTAHTVHVGNWAEQVDFLGGDLALEGMSETGRRLYFIENFDFQVNFSGANPSELDLTNITYPDGANIRVDWQSIQGLWVLEGCTGFKLHDGRTFVGETDPSDRSIEIGGSTAEFSLKLNTLDAADVPTDYQLMLNWTGIETGSEVTLSDTILAFQLPQQRHFAVQSIDLRIYSDVGDLSQMLKAELNDQAVSIALDWTNMAAFRLANDELGLTFTDQPRSSTTRRAVNLSRFEALNDVIQIIYKDQDDVPGEERLLLPRSESYLEIVTPAGLPTYDGTSLPGQPGYAPRALNNLGGECYPVNTFLPQANCPPAGDINPANGNLWYTATDLQTSGYLIDLDLVRSYNSRAAHIDGPFGLGWTTIFRLDYAIPFDSVANARPVTPDTLSYNVGLDVTWAPRGVVTFTTASGSQHVFVSADDYYTGGKMQALTMPGWRLTHTDPRAPIWQLTQDNGQIFEFDRAGRLIRFGYPEAGRMIEINYPRDTLNGPGSLGIDQAVTIRDSSEPLRQIELYYNAEHRISRAVLRDVTRTESASPTCLPTENCFETTYIYEGSLLREVHYADGQRALYTYTDNRLDGHDDPRAPIAPTMRYVYDSDNNLTRAVLLSADSTELPWRTLVVAPDNGSQRIAGLTDEWNNTRTYTYQRNAGALKAVGDTFTLVEETSPLADVDDYERVAQTYTWENGLLTRIDARIGQPEQGRNSIDIQYTPTGRVSCVGCGYRGIPEFQVFYQPARDVPADVHYPESITYSDGATEEFIYDGGRVISHKDRTGATYTLTWSGEPYRLLSRQRNEDNTLEQYQYNSIGLITQITHSASSGGNAYTINYTWDALGRLIALDDSVLGRYTIEHGLPQTDENGGLYTEVIITDPVGVRSIQRFDRLGRLIETRTEDTSGLLRRTTYAYDTYNRLKEETQWLSYATDNPQSVTTTYEYEPLAALPPSTSELPEIPVRGYQVTVTDPLGRATRYVFDALGRLRSRSNDHEGTSRYTYSIRDTGFNLGLRITQQRIAPGSTTAEAVDYLFDVRRQLIGVQRGAMTWEMSMDGDTARYRAVSPRYDQRAATLQEVTWTPYVDGLPEAVNIRQANMSLVSNFNVQDVYRPSLSTERDFLNRPIRIIESTERERQIIYCPLAEGQIRQLYFTANNEGNTPSCENGETAELSLTYDAHQRLIEAIDETGTRSFAYSADAQAQRWRLSVTFVDVSGNTSAWSMAYNGMGELTEWMSEVGTRTYEYDTLGRLRATSIDGEPELSYRFRYNAVGNLTEAIDEIGRGFLYNYNALGQLINRLDVRTADTFSYAYTPSGLLSTIISPDGNTTSYLYEDPENPDRLTRIIEPSGSQSRFDWHDDTNTLSYTSPLNQPTSYMFDGMGLLWRIDDPVLLNEAARRSHELHYDNAGYMTDWLRSIEPNSNGRAAQHLTLILDNAGWLTVADAGETGWEQRLLSNANRQLEQIGSTIFRYDAQHRLIQIETAANRTWTLRRDASQPQIDYVDGFGQSALLRYDAAYRLRSRSALDVTDTYTYTYQPDETSDVTLNVERPGVGNRSYIISPGNINDNSAPGVILRAPGQQVSYRYTADGLLTDIQTEICSNGNLPDIATCIDEDVPVWSRVAQIVYDANSRPIRIIDENGRFETLAYDAVGNLTAYQNAGGKTFTYAYDSANRLVSVTSPTGVKLLLEYNSLDLPASICRTRVEANVDYAGCVEAGGELERYHYDSLGRLLERSYPQGENSVGSQTYNYEEGRLSGWGSDVRFVYDGMGLLQQFVVGDQQYPFAYSGLNQLATAGDVNYTYDAAGRVATLQTAGHTINFDHLANGYSFRDATGFQASYLLDARGFFNAFLFGSANTPVFTTTYAEAGVDLHWDDDVILSLIPNQNLTYIDGSNMGVFYEDAPGGVSRRQTVILPYGGGGYVVILGYDDDERPLTMRVTETDADRNPDTADLNVLYTQTFTYDTLGRRTQEIRQYQDGVQILVQYNYANTSQLASRIVTVIFTGQQLTAGFLSIFSLGLVSITHHKSRRYLFSALLLLVLVTSVVPLSAQQGRSITYTYAYRYDPMGNLQTVTNSESGRVCANYTYDALNRLIKVAGADNQRNYRYDAYNRLSDVDGTRLIYHGGDHRLLALVANNSPYYYVQSGSLPLMIANAGETQRLLNDARQRILQMDTQEQNDVWLFDPLSRSLSFASPLPDADPCQLVSPLTIPNMLTLQPAQNEMIWDAAANLYFDVDGRAYAPEIGTFLQRDPHGPDILGSVYDYPNRANTPPIRPLSPAYGEGLSTLRAAQRATHIESMLTAEAVRQWFMPSLNLDEFALFEQLEMARQPYSHVLTNLSYLPTWLEQNYNLPAPSTDPLTGALAVNLGNVPGSIGTEGEPSILTALPDWHRGLRPSMEAPGSTFTRLAQSAVWQETRLFTTYEPYGWQRDLQPLSVTQATPTHPTANAFEPEAVLPLLPGTLEQPEQAAYLFDALPILQDMPQRAEYEWLTAALESTLPQMPQLPPRDLAQWRQDWFSNDTLSTADLVAPPLPESVSLPVYELGVNENWLHIVPQEAVER